MPEPENQRPTHLDRLIAISLGIPVGQFVDDLSQVRYVYTPSKPRRVSLPELLANRRSVRSYWPNPVTLRLGRPIRSPRYPSTGRSP